MRVAILHGAVPEDAPEDERDVLVETEAIAAALARLGHDTCQLTFDIDLRETIARLGAARPELVFNLVESVDGRGSLIHFAPAVLDFLGIRYTGASTEAQFLTSNKLVAKRLLRGAGIATPAWMAAGQTGGEEIGAGQATIIKSVWEHASVGLDEDSVLVPAVAGQLRQELERRCSRLGGACFAEAFVEGREFNLSVLAGPHGPEVLPPAEISFDAYPEGKRRVVGFKAKWDEASFEYQHTPRRFDFVGEEALVAELADAAVRCWRLFELRGYARVDFRVDHAEQPWVLEINTNPCISPDAGFMAAAGRAGLTIDQVVQRILADTPLRTVP
jgi:D-alanine-D-alanine ligase